MTQNPTPRRFERPASYLTWTEGARAMWDLGQFGAGLPLLAAAPRGDGHGVLVLPGFLADDRSTRPLRTVLRGLGYRPAGWRLGRNLGPTKGTDRAVRERLAQVYAATDRPVSIVGWSLGGFYARWLAREDPDLVRQVITLGTPFRLTSNDEPGITSVGRLYHAMRPMHTADFASLPRERHAEPLPVPATAIYSRLDGIVPWRACLELPGPLSESVEVPASHCGLGFHPHTIAVVLDRLSQPLGRWQPYLAAAA